MFQSCAARVCKSSTKPGHCARSVFAMCFQTEPVLETKSTCAKIVDESFDDCSWLRTDVTDSASNYVLDYFVLVEDVTLDTRTASAHTNKFSGFQPIRAVSSSRPAATTLSLSLRCAVATPFCSSCPTNYSREKWRAALPFKPHCSACIAGHSADDEVSHGTVMSTSSTVNRSTLCSTNRTSNQGDEPHDRMRKRIARDE